MSARWYTGVIRWVATHLMAAADRLDAPSFYAPPLDAKAQSPRPDEIVVETRHRVARYY
jgi:hypothetical protein